MDVGLAADRRGVAEPLRHALDRLDDVLLRLGVGVERLELLQGQRAEDRAGPGAEVLGGEVLPGDLPEVLVDIARVDRPMLPVVVEVLEEFVAGDLLAAPDDPREAPVLDADLPLLAALAAELEAQLGVLDGDVVVAHRRQAERVVLPGVLLVADADQRLLQELDDRRQDLLARQAGPRQVAVSALADAGQRLPEGEHPLVLRLVAHLAPARVVAVLLAPLGVTPGRLEVAQRIGADPDVGVGRRDAERLDPRQLPRVADRPAVEADVTEALARALAADAGRGVGDVVQAGGARRLDRIDDRLGRRRRGGGGHCFPPKVTRLTASRTVVGADS